MTQSRKIHANVKDADLIEERRDAILRAGLEVFLTRGFHAAKSNEVAVRAGLTQGTLYNYIRTKGDILYLICDQAISRYHAAVEAAVAGVEDPKQRLVRAVRATVQAQVQHRDHILVVLREGHALDPESQRLIRNRVDSFLDRMKVMVEDCSDDIAVREIGAGLIVEVITYLPTVAAMRRWRLRHEFQSDRVVDGLCTMLFRMLGINPDD